MGLRPTGLRRSRGLPLPHPDGKVIERSANFSSLLGVLDDNLSSSGDLPEPVRRFWARSLGRQIYMNGHLNIDKYDDEADYAIFDDISGGFQFSKLQRVAWLPRRIRVHGQIPSKDYNLLGRPTIMCMNSDP